MIGGFILGQGTLDANVVVRGLGPSLSRFMLIDVLADPILELRDANGALLIANDNWQDDPVMAAQLTAYDLQPIHPLESAIFARLAPGAFTSIVVGKNGDVGIALVELYTIPILVTSTADSGPGSLRDAIAAARDGDTIQFDPALNGQTINLTSGELLIDQSISIKGFQLYPLPVQRSPADGTPTFRIFHITPGHTVQIEGLKISGGYSPQSGGGVLNDQATLILRYCVVEGNYSAGQGGGGICNSGGNAILTVLNSTVAGNLNSGIAFGNGGEGGGISNDGMLTLTDSTVSGNSVTAEPPHLGRAGGIFSLGTLEITNSTISNNNGGLSGGGIYGRTMAISNSTVSYNRVRGYGGGIQCDGVLTTTISNSTISGNMAVHKSGGFGGGIYNGGPLTVTNSTLSGNLADGGGGGIYNLGTVEIENTILKAGSPGANILNSSGTVVSQGYNLSSDNGGGFLTAIGDQINTDPLLGPLENNSGPTFTHELLIGSPAIDAGDLFLISGVLAASRTVESTSGHMSSTQTTDNRIQAPCRTGVPPRKGSTQVRCLSKSLGRGRPFQSDPHADREFHHENEDHSASFQRRVGRAVRPACFRGLAPRLFGELRRSEVASAAVELGGVTGSECDGSSIVGHVGRGTEHGAKRRFLDCPR
jgi:hypothetical protein